MTTNSELISSAAACTDHYDVSRRLLRALRSVAPSDIIEAAERAQKSGQGAPQTQPIGKPRPSPRTDAEIVWCWLDQHHGREISSAAIDRAREIVRGGL